MSTNESWSTYDQDASGLATRDFSPILEAALRMQQGIISEIPVGRAIYARKIEWMQDSMNAFTVQLDGAVVAGDTVWTFDTTTPLKEDDILMSKTLGKNEAVRIVNIINATQANVERAHGDTTMATAAESHADNAVFEIATAQLEGSDRGPDRTTTKSVQNFNYPQIFSIDTSITGTELEILYFWQQVMGVGKDEFAEQMAKRTIEETDNFNKAVLHGTRDAGSSSVGRSMNGILNYIRHGDGANGDGTGASAPNTDLYISGGTVISYDEINNRIGAMYDLGVTMGQTPNLCLYTTRVLMEKMGEWPDDQVRRAYAPNGQTYGNYITGLVTRSGIEIPVKIEPFLRGTASAGQLAIIDRSKWEIHPLGTRTWKLYVDEVGTNGVDAKKGRLLGEWTLEFRNATTNHALYDNMTVS